MKVIKKTLKTVQIPATSARIYIPAEEHPRNTLITGLEIKTEASNVSITVQNPRTGEVYNRNPLAFSTSILDSFSTSILDEDLKNYIWPEAMFTMNFVFFTFPKGRGAHPWIMYGLPSRELEIELNSTDNLNRVEVIGYYTMHDTPILSPFIQYSTLTYVGIDARAKFVIVKPAYIITGVVGDLSSPIRASVYQDGVRTREDFKIPGSTIFFPDPADVPEVLTIETIDPVPSDITLKIHIFKLVTPSDMPVADRVPVIIGPNIPFDEGVVGREME